MTKNAYDILKERGFIYQSTDEEGLRDMLGKSKISCYIGFDPTAESLHVGSLVPIMALVHMQRAGHRPIAIVGGGTALVGDPSGKTEMRKMLTIDQINKNGEGIKSQLAHYISFDKDRAIMLNNAEWLVKQNYIEFLREIGRHFSVNRMLGAESYKVRLETGLSFLEFNYMLLQAYDFLVLEKEHNCPLQMGGQDQWGNIVAGIDLIRRKSNRPAYGVTFPLITNSSGEKFGKSVAGAVWLNEDKTPPFEYYQFWRNTEDNDVKKFLGLFTLLPIDEVNYLGCLKPPLLNRAKEILAYEAVLVTHGREKADAAFSSAIEQFGTADPGGTVETSSSINEITAAQKTIIPETELVSSYFEGEGMRLVDLMVEINIVPSKSEGRRLITGGGVSRDDTRVTDVNERIRLTDIRDGSFLLKLGKKRFYRITVK